MLPLRDTIRSSKIPVVTWVLIGVNTLVFLYEISLSSNSLNQLIMTYGLVPAHLDLPHPAGLLIHPQPLISFLTHMFLHGGWFHLISNMWILFIFGDNVEDRMGRGRYLLFYLISGFVAGLAQVLIDPTSSAPAVGASGAIAGVLGAYFIMFPAARVLTLIPIFFFPWFVEIPAIFYLGFWFLSQLFSGISSLNLVNQAVGGVAWWAHIGGFIFGILFYRFFISYARPIYTNRFPDNDIDWRR
jgi:membrane associated rhomboid family serine protease